MEYIMDTEHSPLSGINTSFEDYLRRKKAEQSIHMHGTVPDYAFAMDYELRRKLDNIPHFYSLARKISSTLTTRYMQIYNQKSLLVGPSQFPEIYQMGVDCAHTLGIPVPNIYVYSSTEMNAFTVASADTSPLIVLHTGIIDRMTPGELKCVIAHECGHIHNQHLVYKLVINEILSTASGIAGGVAVTLANVALMTLWTRASEISADRAALICANSVEDAINVDYKLLSGGTINTLLNSSMDLNTLHSQLEEALNNPTRFEEAFVMSPLLMNKVVLADHPSAMRRIFADLAFEECDLFYSWRPDLKKPGMHLRSKQETDARCQKLINIWNNK